MFPSNEGHTCTFAATPLNVLAILIYIEIFSPGSWDWGCPDKT